MTGIEIVSVLMLIVCLTALAVSSWVLRKRRTHDPKMIIYANLIHRHGVDSEQTLAYLEENKDDETFLHQAKMLDKLRNLATGDWDAILNKKN